MQTPDQIRNLLQGTIDAIEDAVKILAPDYQILFVNSASERMTGKTCDAVVGMLCFQTRGKLEPCSHCALRKVVETGQSQHLEFITENPQGQNRVFEQQVYPLRNEQGELAGVVEVTRDVTEKRAFERHLMHNEKLTALGKLAFSVAHEVRNPLTGVRLGLESLMDDTLSTGQKEVIAAVSDDVRRLDQTLNQLLDLARRKEPIREEANLGELIDRSIFFIRKFASDQHVELKVNLQQDLPKLFVDSDQLRQVFLNLFLNSLQAMPEGGVLQISGTMITYQERSGVMIAIRDTGPGFTAEASGHLFDMFFTTKPTGSGVGLALSSRIISDHGGLLWVENLREGGALVSLFLPFESMVTLDETEYSVS
jgi:PAS domain S-box-containing protein